LLFDSENGPKMLFRVFCPVLRYWCKLGFPRVSRSYEIWKNFVTKLRCPLGRSFSPSIHHGLRFCGSHSDDWSAVRADIDGNQRKRGRLDPLNAVSSNRGSSRRNTDSVVRDYKIANSWIEQMAPETHCRFIQISDKKCFGSFIVADNQSVEVGMFRVKHQILVIPMKVVSDSDLIPVTHSDAMAVTVGAKRRWRSYGA